MTKGIAEAVKIISRSKRSGKVEVAITTNGYTKTRHGVAMVVEGRPAVKVREPIIGEVVIVIPQVK